MFTGIVQHLGKVLQVRGSAAGRVLRLDLGGLAEAVRPGGSVAVNGTCLTARSISGQAGEFDVVSETLDRTNLGSVSSGTVVNLELPLTASDPIDGHFVLGHIDGLARLDRLLEAAEQHVIWLSVPQELAGYLVPKGSVALDGVSLTIAEVRDNNFSVALIPTTLQRTTLSIRKVGDMLNLETDYLAKIVLRTVGLVTGQKDQRSLLDKLRSAGFGQ